MYDNTLNVILEAMLSLDEVTHSPNLPKHTKEKVWEAMKRIMDVRDVIIEAHNANNTLFNDQRSVTPGVH